MSRNHTRVLTSAFASILCLTAAAQTTHPFEGPSPVTGPYLPKVGELDVRFQLGEETLAFRALAVPLPVLPMSLYIPASPLGYGGVLGDPALPPGSALLGFEHLGGLVPMQWTGPYSRWSGSLGALEVVLRQAPTVESGFASGLTVSQGPGGGDPPKITIREVSVNDVDGIVIGIQEDATADTGFIQFVTVTITWEGSSCGVPVSGVGAGPQTSGANGGRPMATDGGTTYVDSSNPNGSGEYPHQGSGPVETDEGPPQDLREMGDMPNFKDPEKIAADIVEGGECLSVETITLEQRFTAYAWVQEAGQPRRYVAKIEWSFTETLDVSDGPSPGNKDGDFGGPAAGPPAPGSIFTNGLPAVTPVTGMDPNHQAALNGFQQGNGNGAPSGSW